MVKLRDFVRDAIVEIVHAVKEAQEATEHVGARVNPADISGPGGRSIYDGRSRLHVEDVRFDVAVTATEGSDMGTKIGVLAGVFGAGAHGNVSEQAKAVSRIQFSVAVAMPIHAGLTKTITDEMGGHREVPAKD